MADESSTSQSPSEHAVADGSSTLSADQLRSAHDAQRGWEGVERATASSRLIDPDLSALEAKGARGQRYVRVMRSSKQGFERVAPGWLQATQRAEAPTGGFARFRRRLRRYVLGNPLRTADAVHERLTKLKALAVLSSDALSSVAYATDQILLVLGTAGLAAYGYIKPIMVAILVLLAIVVLSYRQTIRAYPHGGGSYIVASDNLGPLAGLIAGCALMTSYTLTVAVSVAAGVQAIIAALPSAEPYRVQLCVLFIALLTLGNLRGIREAGAIFALPTYAFIAGIFVLLGTLTFKLLTGAVHGHDPVFNGTVQDVTGFSLIFLVLRAFAQGATALTGVEAISDGVPAFKPPEWRNARRTLSTMGAILGTMFLGITVLAFTMGVTAKEDDTVISQLAQAAFGRGVIYGYIAVTTTGILVLAGNTAFSDFPRLLFFMARDHYAPHQFKRLGDRLAFSNGILVLGMFATILVVVFGGKVEPLIPLYAVGVFTAFTMSQAGMVARWLRRREKGWQQGLAMNILGMVTCATVLLVVGGANFVHGAFITVILVPVLVLAARAIHLHYTELETQVSTETPTSPKTLNPVCIVPIADFNPVALQSLAMARTICDTVIAVHICDDEQHIARLRAQWEEWGSHVPLEIIESPYRSLVRPLLAYIDAVDRQQGNDTIVVVLPELVATRWWHHILHNQTALRLKAALLFRPGTVVVNVPYHLSKRRRVHRRARDTDPEAL